MLLEGWEHCPAWGQGFVMASAALGSQLDQRNSEVFSNRNHSGVVWGNRDCVGKSLPFGFPLLAVPQGTLETPG